jgi:hypothetical protein
MGGGRGRAGGTGDMELVGCHQQQLKTQLSRASIKSCQKKKLVGKLANRSC